MATEQRVRTESDYERIGGAPAVRTIVDRFYQLILADDQLAGVVEGSDMAHLKRRQTLLISQVLGGPADYDGRELGQAHAGMGIARDDHRKVVSYLVQTMVEVGVLPAIIMRVSEALAARDQDFVTVHGF